MTVLIFHFGLVSVRFSTPKVTFGFFGFSFQTKEVFQKLQCLKLLPSLTGKKTKESQFLSPTLLLPPSTDNWMTHLIEIDLFSQGIQITPVGGK